MVDGFFLEGREKASHKQWPVPGSEFFRLRRTTRIAGSSMCRVVHRSAPLAVRIPLGARLSQTHPS